MLSVQVLGPALVVLALALIVLYELGARRPVRRDPAQPLSGPVRPVVDGR
ncbi:hypothetical protein [Micromonospora sp. WMMD710]|nr:hypothetical protein [Micromonospora sp. WMMD710]MDG4758838.1 hypothetical protein [Micromonospora sp. WMMD710]